jgi:nicotinamidase-related amidase
MFPGKRRAMLMKAPQSCLLVIDIQGRLAPAVVGRDRIVANTGVLMRAAARLGVPVMVSEQYPKGLGPTVPEVARLAGDGALFAKMHFSCLGDRDYALHLAGLGRKQMVVAGMEAHVCVLQTVLQLLADDYDVFVAADAIGSRAPENRELALERMRAAGAVVVSTEMVMFEWLEKAGTPEFKELSALIK